MGCHGLFQDLWCPCGPCVVDCTQSCKWAAQNVILRPRSANGLSVRPSTTKESYFGFFPLSLRKLILLRICVSLVRVPTRSGPHKTAPARSEKSVCSWVLCGLCVYEEKRLEKPPTAIRIFYVYILSKKGHSSNIGTKSGTKERESVPHS